MEEYNHAMRTAVALWDAAEDAALEPLRSSAFHIPGGVRPILGSEARTILAQYAYAMFNQSYFSFYTMNTSLLTVVL